MNLWSKLNDTCWQRRSHREVLPTYFHLTLHAKYIHMLNFLLAVKWHGGTCRIQALLLKKYIYVYIFIEISFYSWDLPTCLGNWISLKLYLFSYSFTLCNSLCILYRRMQRRRSYPFEVWIGIVGYLNASLLLHEMSQIDESTFFYAIEYVGINCYI